MVGYGEGPVGVSQPMSSRASGIRRADDLLDTSVLIPSSEPRELWKTCWRTATYVQQSIRHPKS